MLLRSARPLLALTIALVAFAGCDTTDPVTPVEPAEVVGIYDFVEFRFNPDPTFVPDAIVLDTLIQDRTSIELLDSGQFQFRYRIEGGLDNIINGTFSAGADRVTLSFEEGFEGRLRALLLDRTLRFDRTMDTDVLTLSATKRVDLEAYAAEYRGTGLDLSDVPGRLTVELRRQGL